MELNKAILKIVCQRWRLRQQERLDKIRQHLEKFNTLPEAEQIIYYEYIRDIYEKEIAARNAPIETQARFEARLNDLLVTEFFPAEKPFSALQVKSAYDRRYQDHRPTHKQVNKHLKALIELNDLYIWSRKYQYASKGPAHKGKAVPQQYQFNALLRLEPNGLPPDRYTQTMRGKAFHLETYGFLEKDTF